MITVHTIGHSTRSFDEFAELLREFGIQDVADVRSVPRSRHNPQFDADTLQASLGAAGFAYRHLPGLGGFRHARKDSPNAGWRSSAFRGYADYMLTPEFSVALEELIALAESDHYAVMCAEVVPWRCHRSLIGDALTVRGIEVIDIFGPSASRPHVLTSFAHVDGTKLTYPAPAPDPPVRASRARPDTAR